MLTEQSNINKPIKNVQTYLRRISYNNNIPKIIPDGIYGNQTKEAVTEFQKIFNLPQTGEIDNDTWNKIIEEYKITLKKFTEPTRVGIFPSPHFVIRTNDKNGIVYVVQAMIKALGDIIGEIPTIEISGIYDTATQEAVTAIQIMGGVDKSGEVNKETWEIISALFETFISHNYISPIWQNGDYIIKKDNF